MGVNINKLISGKLGKKQSISHDTYRILLVLVVPSSPPIVGGVLNQVKDVLLTLSSRKVKSKSFSKGL